MNKRNLCALSAVVFVIASCAYSQTTAGAPPASQPAIRIGYDTTRITKPLRADGTVDYLAALNAIYSRGVTPDNNAAVLMLQAFDPEEFICDSIREAVLDELGVEPTGEDRYFQSIPDELDQAYPAAQGAPWRGKDHPELLNWLEQNKAPLSRVIEASRRPRYYLPMSMTLHPDNLLPTIVLPSFGQYRKAARALVIRANLAVAEERFEDAWSDILAVHRLGALMNQSPTVIGRLVGMAMSSLAAEATTRLATADNIPGPTARTVLQDLLALSPSPTIVSAYDQFERFCLLDAITFVFRDPENYEDFVKSMREDADADKDPESAALKQRMLSFAKIPSNWNEILPRVNAHFDRITKAMRATTFIERVEALQTMAEQIKQMNEELFPIKAADLQDPKGPARWLGNWVLSDMFGGMASFGRTQEISDQTGTYRDLAVVAAALAVYRSENGGYPDTLDALAPGILKSVPDDFLGAKPFIYKPAGGGYLLYSVGINTKDDGGRTREQGDDTDDLVVRRQGD